MSAAKVAVLGFEVPKWILSGGSTESIKEYMSNEKNIYGRILFTLSDYLTKHSKMFDKVSYHITDEGSALLPNGTLKGLIGNINRSECDICVQPITMNERTSEIADFSYPYRLYSATFVTSKAEYEPHILGLLQVFPLSLWVSIISILMTMCLVYYITFGRKYSFAESLFHSFAVLLRQSSILKPSSRIENLLVFLWVVGAMFFCLAYDSVSLSFLTFPPINQIKDVAQLANAVKKGDFHGVTIPQSPILNQLIQSKQENLKIIGEDANTNEFSKDLSIFRDLLRGRNRKGIAIILDTDSVDMLSVGNKFVSEDRFLESMAAATVTKGFCCKRLVEKFVDRLMASGLYSKYSNDKSFVFRLPRLLAHEEEDDSKRKLTLTDVAPAFIFLIFGHFISLLVFIVEVVSCRVKSTTQAEQEHSEHFQPCTG